jgi:CheY-like chemotaxis protein
MASPAKTIRLILVVDQDKEVRAFLAESLMPNGFGVWEAPGADAAIKILNDRRIDLVIGDAAQLEPDGEKTLRKLRRFQPVTKILAMTGTFPAVATAPRFVRLRSRFPILEPGGLNARLFLRADATLPKPVSVDLMIEITRKLLGES